MLLGKKKRGSTLLLEVIISVIIFAVLFLFSLKMAKVFFSSEEDWSASHKELAAKLEELAQGTPGETTTHLLKMSKNSAIIGLNPVMDQDYYRLLKVQAAATPDQIKQAYDAAAARYSATNPAHAQALAELKRAYDTLSDPAKKKEYDDFKGFRSRNGRFGDGDFHLLFMDITAVPQIIHFPKPSACDPEQACLCRCTNLKLVNTQQGYATNVVVIPTLPTPYISPSFTIHERSMVRNPPLAQQRNLECTNLDCVNMGSFFFYSPAKSTYFSRIIHDPSAAPNVVYHVYNGFAIVRSEESNALPMDQMRKWVGYADMLPSSVPLVMRSFQPVIPNNPLTIGVCIFSDCVTEMENAVASDLITYRFQDDYREQLVALYNKGEANWTPEDEERVEILTRLIELETLMDIGPVVTKDMTEEYDELKKTLDDLNRQYQ